MDQKEQKRIATHESIHGLLALSCAEVHRVRAYPVGETELSFPFTPFSMSLHYRKQPEQTHRRLIEILSVLMGPHVIQGAPLEGGDDVADWKAAYNSIPAASLHWASVMDQVRAYVRQWYRVEGRAALIENVAEALSKRVVVYGDSAWRKLVQGCMPPRQAPRPMGRIDLNRLSVENIECLTDLYDWRMVGRAGVGVVLQS